MEIITINNRSVAAIDTSTRIADSQEFPDLIMPAQYMGSNGSMVGFKESLGEFFDFRTLFTREVFSVVPPSHFSLKTIFNRFYARRPLWVQLPLIKNTHPADVCLLLAEKEGGVCYASAASVVPPSHFSLKTIFNRFLRSKPTLGSTPSNKKTHTLRACVFYWRRRRELNPRGAYRTLLP